MLLCLLSNLIYYVVLSSNSRTEKFPIVGYEMKLLGLFFLYLADWQHCNLAIVCFEAKAVLLQSYKQMQQRMEGKKNRKKLKVNRFGCDSR